MRAHDQASAETWIAKGMKVLGLAEAALAQAKMNCPEKYALARLVRRNTSARLGWIKARLRMGTATCLAVYLKNWKQRGAAGGVMAFGAKYIIL